MLVAMLGINTQAWLTVMDGAEVQTSGKVLYGCALKLNMGHP